MHTLLLVHNYYQQPGGEDESFAAEADLLEQRGHRVLRYTTHNERVDGMPRLELAKSTVWNTEAYRDLRLLIQKEKPQIVHFNNTFPLISPSAYYAARAEGIPIVQSLRNYRLFCLNGLFFREGSVCERCVGKSVPWSGVFHACYRDDRLASGVVATMLSVHRAMGTWSKMVDIYVTLTQFARQKFIQAGMPAEKILFKPNFLSHMPDPGNGSGHYALFVGRLSPEKGLGTVIEAWKRLGGKIPIKIVGDGPSGPLVAQAAEQVPGIEWLGRRSVQEVYELMGNAQMLVFPSEWYETFGRVAMEAFAKGTPVIAANIGAIAELVEHGRTGLHFQPGDAADLATQVEWALAHPAAMNQMRRAARTEFENKYTADRNYEMMLTIYQRALEAGSKSLKAL